MRDTRQLASSLSPPNLWPRVLIVKTKGPSATTLSHYSLEATETGPHPPLVLPHYETCEWF